jgi:8-amino-7-oxononanoate synthase
LSDLETFALTKLRALGRRNLRRSLEETERKRQGLAQRRGQALISLACNDYLGLATDPATTAAAIEATRQFGVGAGAARLITGNHPLYTELERKLAEIKGTEAAIVFGSGYLANIGVIPVFAGREDLLVHDELVHSSILTGTRLSRATVRQFPHNDIDALAALLANEREKFRHCLIVTDGVFSMEGDLADLPGLTAVANRYDAWLMTDDAHGLGVVGAGRGSTFAHSGPVTVPLQMGTLSKAIGSYGGYLCASASVIELVMNRARSFVYSTGLPPGAVAAASCALDIIGSDHARVARPLDLARRFTDQLGLRPAESAIVPLVVGSVADTLAASSRLAEAGFLVPAIRPPTVPAGTSRLRFAFSAALPDSALTRLIDAVQGLGIAIPAS